MHRSFPRLLQIFSAALLLSLLVYGYGVMSVRYKLWPYSELLNLEAFVAGHQEEHVSLQDKLLNDLGMVPGRHFSFPPPRSLPADAYQKWTGLSLGSRKQAPEVYMGPDAPEGYRLVQGVFDFEDTLHAALLINAEGKLEHIWPLTQQNVTQQEGGQSEGKLELLPDFNVFPHGMEVLRDGSLITIFDDGVSMSRTDWCGRTQWVTPGGFHHSLALDEDGTVWTWRNDSREEFVEHHLQQVSVEDGAVLRSIPILDIVSRNWFRDPLGIRQDDREEESIWTPDPFHPNDVEPLPAAWADAYPQFETGDLLMNLRSLNLVLVVDPDTLKIKWWRGGVVRRGHDPDWNPRGTLTVFDNNMHRKYSRIVEIDPQTYESRVLVRGHEYDFTTWIRGKHQQMEDGGILITSTQQGRVFEVGPDGAVRFEFLNIYDDKVGLDLSEARYLPKDFFADLPECAASGD